MAVHAPLLAFFFICDIALPFIWVCSALAWGVRSLTHQRDADLYVGLLHVRSHAFFIIVLLTVLTSALAMCLRQARHIAEVPSDFFWMPLYILFSTLVLMPIRLYGFFRCGHLGGWGTRANAFSADPTVGEHQAAELEAPIVAGTSTVMTRRPAASTTSRDQSSGDPRSIVPYLIGSAIIILGVLYDVRPV